MLSKKIDGQTLVCMRPEYKFPLLDRSLQSKAFSDAGERIYGSHRAVAIELDGTQWFHIDLTSENLVNFFLHRPEVYLQLMEERRDDYKIIRTNVERAKSYFDGSLSEDIDVQTIMDGLCTAYIFSLRYVFMANLIVEKMMARFTKIVENIFSTGVANIFLTSIISTPVVSIAANAKFFEDRRGTKRIQDVRSMPVSIFAEMIPYRSSCYDDEFYRKSFSKGNSLSDAHALRMLAPLSVQLAEEFRYADYSIRTNMKWLIENRMPCKLQTTAYDMPYQKIIEKLSEESS